MSVINALVHQGDAGGFPRVEPATLPVHKSLVLEAVVAEPCTALKRLQGVPKSVSLCSASQNSLPPFPGHERKGVVLLLLSLGVILRKKPSDGAFFAPNATAFQSVPTVTPEPMPFEIRTKYAHALTSEIEAQLRSCEQSKIT